MNDLIEKVKQGLRCCADPMMKKCDRRTCPYRSVLECRMMVARDARSVIEQMEQRIKQFMQEQEPLEPVVFGNGKTFEEADTWWYGCPVCKKPVDTTDNFCRKCGRALIWQKDGENE